MKPLDEIETFKEYLDEYILHDELLTQLYNSLSLEYKEKMKQEWEDIKLITKHFDEAMAIHDAMDRRLQRIAELDLAARAKRMNIGKLSSEKSRQLLGNKNFTIKEGEHYISYALLTTKRPHLVASVTTKFKTDKGSWYINSDEKGVLIFTGHCVDRYMERNSIPSFEDALSRLTNELFQSSGVHDTSDTDIRGRICRGRILPHAKYYLGSGMLLGFGGVSSNRSIMFFKTFISVSMLRESQDEEHAKAWEIMLERAKGNKILAAMLNVKV